MALDLLRARLGLNIDDEVRIIHGTVDPSQAPGVFAERASLFMQDTGTSGLLWIKVGDLDTDWAVVGTGSEFGVTGLQGETGIQGVTGPAGLGTTGLSGATGVQGLSGDGITWIHAAMLGSATSTFGQFSIQAGNANPFGIPISSPYDQYNNGGVNAIKIPFDYELKEIYLSLGHCAVDSATADTVVYANIEFHRFEGLYSTSIGTVQVPLDGTNCGVFNNLGSNNFQKASVADISGIEGTVGDLIGFRFQNVSGSANLNALSRCTILAKLQKKNWTPGGTKGETGLQGDTGAQGPTGPQGTQGVTGEGVQGTTGAQGATGSPGSIGIDGVTGPQGLTGLRGLDGVTGSQGATGVLGETGVQGTTGPAGLGTTGLLGATGLQGLSGDGITWIHAAMLGSATSTFGQFSLQPGNANPFGTPISSPYDQYNNGGVNAIKIPFDYELKEVYISLGHCAVDSATADTVVYANIEFHRFEGMTSTSLGTVQVPLDGANCGVFNNLGGNNFQKASVTNISGIEGTVGDLVGFRFQNVTGSANLNAISRCTILAKLQRKDWTPGGTKGETGLQGVTGSQGESGVTGAPGDTCIWSQAALLGQAVSTIGYFSTQPGNANPYGVPVSSGVTSYGNGGVNPYRMPWGYYVSEVHVTLAHCAVSTASASPIVNFNLDFYGYTGAGNAYKGRLSIPFNGASCGVYNNLGGDNYQYAGLTGLNSITGFMGELVGFQFQNVQGSSDINAVSRASVLVKFQKI